MKQKISWGSVLTGLILGSLIGWYISGLVDNIFPYSNVILHGIPIILLGLLALKKPKFVEYLAYAISVYVLLQYAWDYRVGDRGELRFYLFINALISLVVNIFTGKVRLIGAQKTFRRAIGL